MLAAGLWHVGCRWPSCVTLPGQGQLFPMQKQLSRFATWHFNSNESHSLKSPCLPRACIHNRPCRTSAENIKLSVYSSRQSWQESMWGVPKKACKHINLYLFVSINNSNTSKFWVGERSCTYTGSSCKSILTTWDIHLSYTVYLSIALSHSLTIIELEL